jgi:hypothetical protein
VTIKWRAHGRREDQTVIFQSTPASSRSSAWRARCSQRRRLLHVWSLTAVAVGQPCYYEELAAARAGTATTIPVSDAIPDWAERAAVARGRR